MAHNKVYVTCENMCMEEGMTKADIIGLAGDVYDNTATYNVGDLVIYNNTLYKCNTAISTPEEWNSTHWTATTINEVKVTSLGVSKIQVVTEYPTTQEADVLYIKVGS